MEKLGIVSGLHHVFVMPIKDSKQYYCLWWGFKKTTEFTLSKGYSWCVTNKLRGPQELTVWLD